METTQANGLERSLNLTIPLNQLQEEVAKRLKHLSKTAKMQGFRPGKVPLSLLEKQYGGQLHQEALGDLAQNQFFLAIKENKFKVAGYPSFDANPDHKEESTIGLVAKFEVFPEIAVGNLKEVTINRPVTEVTDADIDRTLNILRKQRVSYTIVDRVAQNDDQVVIDFKGFIGDEPFQGGEASNYQLVLGQNQFLPDFEANVIGMKQGESKSFELTFPEDYQASNLAGKTVRFDVTIHEVKEPVLPPIDEEFARSVGIQDGDVSKLRAEMKKNLEREVKNRIKSQVKDQVMQALLDKTPIEVPQFSLLQEVQRLRQNTLADLESRTGKKQSLDLPDSLFIDQAKRRVSLGLILGEIINSQSITSKPEQVRALIEEMASAYEQPEEIIRWYYQQKDRLQEAETVVLEDNVVEWVCAQVNTVDAPTSFEDLVGKQ
jgi:trigger factor